MPAFEQVGIAHPQLAQHMPPFVTPWHAVVGLRYASNHGIPNRSGGDRMSVLAPFIPHGLIEQETDRSTRPRLTLNTGELRRMAMAVGPLHAASRARAALRTSAASPRAFK